MVEYLYGDQISASDLIWTLVFLAVVIIFVMSAIKQRWTLYWMTGIPVTIITVLLVLIVFVNFLGFNVWWATLFFIGSLIVCIFALTLYPAYLEVLEEEATQTLAKESERRFKTEIIPPIHEEISAYTNLRYPHVDDFDLNTCQWCNVSYIFLRDVPIKKELPDGTIRFYCKYCRFDINSTLDDLKVFFEASGDIDVQYGKSFEITWDPPNPEILEYRGNGLEWAKRGEWTKNQYGKVLQKIREEHVITALIEDFQQEFDSEWDRAVIETYYDPIYSDLYTDNASGSYGFGPDFTVVFDESGNKTIRLNPYILLLDMDWEQFEVFTMHLLRFQGWDAQLSEREALFEGAEPTIDGGIDVIGTKDDRKVFLQAKHYMQRRPKDKPKSVGRPVVQQTFGAATVEHATDVIVATSGEFTSYAIEFADRVKTQPQEMKLELWDEGKIIDIINKLPYKDYSTIEEIAYPGKDPKVWKKLHKNKS